MSFAGKKHSKESREKIKTSNTGKKSSQWLGHNIGYAAIHAWVRRHYGGADHCENPKCEGKSILFEWALKKGETYRRSRAAFVSLCRSCHRKMDFTESTRLKVALASRKQFFCSVKDCDKPHRAKGYCMKHYNDYARK